MCPFGRRVAAQSVVRYEPEKRHYLSSTQYKQLSSDSAEHDSTAVLVPHTSIYTVSLCPPGLVDQEVLSNMRCTSLRLSSANVAAALFQQFVPILSLLHERTSFLANAQYPVLVEYLDDTVYVFNGFTSPDSQIPVVDAWILDSMKKVSSPYPWRLFESDEHLGSSSILSLSGDQFSYFRYVDSGVSDDCCVHGPVNILDSVLTSGGDESADTVSADQRPMHDVLTKHCGIVTHLVLYRQYLEDHCDTLATLVPASRSSNMPGTSSMSFDNVNYSTNADVDSFNPLNTSQRDLNFMKSYLDARQPENVIPDSEVRDVTRTVCYEVRSSADDYLKNYMRQNRHQSQPISMDHHIYRIVTDDQVELTAFYSTALKPTMKSNSNIFRFHYQDKSKNESDMIVTKVKALFPDGDMITLDLLDQSVVLLSSSLDRSRLFSVEDCLCILRSGSLSHGSDPLSDNHVEVVCRSEVEISLIRTNLPLLLGFLRYVRTPEHARSECVDTDRQLRTLLDVASQQSSRFLVQHRLAYDPLMTREDTTLLRSRSYDKENIETIVRPAHENVLTDVFGDAEPADKEAISEFLSIQASLMKDPNYRNYIARKAMSNCSEYLENNNII